MRLSSPASPVSRPPAATVRSLRPYLRRRKNRENQYGTSNIKYSGYWLGGAKSDTSRARPLRPRRKERKISGKLRINEEDEYAGENKREVYEREWRKVHVLRVEDVVMQRHRRLQEKDQMESQMRLFLYREHYQARKKGASRNWRRWGEKFLSR